MGIEVGVDKDVPVPPRQYHVYPWERLEVGDSFGISRYVNVRVIRCLASRMGKKLGMKFSVREIYDGMVRVWRME